MRQCLERKGANGFPQEITSAEVLPLVEEAADVSFNRHQRVKNALAVVGTNPMNRNRLDNEMILRTAPKNIQEERRRVLSNRQVQAKDSRVSGMQADLLNEGSGYRLGGGDAAKQAVEETVKGLELQGHYSDDIFDLIMRRRALIKGRNEHMQKQADELTELRELYSTKKRMTAGTVFAEGNGMLQEAVRDEVLRREQMKTAKLDAAERKKKKKLWDLSLEVEAVREDIHAKHRGYFQSKGFSSDDLVTESDLDEDKIRALKNDMLKTLVKWKKNSEDGAIPTKKGDLATRLITTMGRKSPNPSPYNSDEEDSEEEYDGEGDSEEEYDGVDEGGEEEE